MRASPRQRQPNSRSEPAGQPRPRVADGQPPSASPALALQTKLQNALGQPKIDERLPIGQRALIVLLLAATSWGLIGALVVAVVRYRS